MRSLTFQSIFDSPADPTGADYNNVAQLPDGRIYEYLHATEAITKDMAISRPAFTAVNTISSSTDADGNIVLLTEISAGWTVNQFANEWVQVDDGTGEGQVGKIQSNTADTLRLYVDYALATALDVADSGIQIIRQTNAEKIPITVKLTPCTGVAPVSHASGDDGWFLIRGIGGVLMGDAAVDNEQIIPGDNTEGTLLTIGSDFDVEDGFIVGHSLGGNTAADKACLADIAVY